MCSVSLKQMINLIPLLHLYLCQGGYAFTLGKFSQQDYTKTPERISTRLGWRMDLGPEYTLICCLWSERGQLFFCTNKLTGYSM